MGGVRRPSIVPRGTSPTRIVRAARRAPGLVRTRRGFTLIETMFAIVILGLGVVVILRSMMTFLYHNMWSTHSATATYLAGEVREMTRNMPRHDRFSGGIYFTVDDDPTTLAGWGPEEDEFSAEDIDDIDDLDGLVLGDTNSFPPGFIFRRRLPGPVNAFGEIVSETLYDGSIERVDVDGEMVDVSMRGWSQVIQVRKLNPTDYSATENDNAFVLGVREVDEYPLLVSVTIVYEGVFEEDAPVTQTISWVVPEEY